MNNLRTQTDEDLLRLYIDGNNSAFDVLLKRYESKVFTYLLYSVRTQELAEDLFQDVFIKIITTLRQKKYTEYGKFSSWVMRIAHNLVIDYFRQSKNDNTVSNDEIEFDLFANSSLGLEESIEAQMIDKQTLEEVKGLIGLLPQGQRDVVLMRFYQDLSFKEIADITGVSINTALGRMRYAIINLRKLAHENKILLVG
ncbi:MAG: sigma-70 family RNA polymerase sigma factor [Bacteroidaceae bacterium]|jgi:RNA polymerase sigma-70 factor (ECF subfamily)|nr:sigma-70 family RNA polymerase sigma factor [Bacteroidaceae bacterium]